MGASRRLTVCADDFALDAAVSSAILELAAHGRISAASCLVDGPDWEDAGRELLRHRDTVLTGLHFNLTLDFGQPRTNPGRAGLGRTILAALTHRLDRAAVTAELERQIERFRAVTGQLPDFIDGHEHVHAFPLINQIVRRTAAEVSPGDPIPIRSVNQFFGPTNAPLKRAVIRFLAARGSRDAAGIPKVELNTGFAGDYSLHANAGFAGLFEAWLETAPDRGLIMCHPRREAPGRAASAGAGEFRFLDSPAFVSLCERYSIRLLRREEIA
jgi:predicted glycoside hydrolase/deacetylase ChbG (UPF0249 family)